MHIIIFASLTDDTTANYLIKALDKYSESVYVFSDVQSPLANKVINSCIDVFEECSKLSINPDLFLFVEGGSMKYFPKGLEKLKCKTAWYGIDTHMDYKKHLAIGKIFDISFIAQKEFVERLLNDGLKNVIWLPLAFEPSLGSSHRPSLKKYLISYVGSNNINMHPKRHELISLISRSFDDCFFGRATPIEMADIYSNSYMVFNKSVNNDVNMRYFEAMGEGAVLLTDRSINNGVDKLFQRNLHFFEYDDNEDLINLIHNLKLNKKKLEEIGNLARLNVLTNHTYNNRAEFILTTTKKIEKLKIYNFSNYLEIFYRLNIFDEFVYTILTIYNSKKSGLFNKILNSSIRINLYLLVTIIKLINYFKHIITYLK